jgi:2-C-methyl-D-erythritol 2,4-cyclodiphosphate synthase
LRSAETSVPRIGFGYDVHRLVTGRALVLGGVEIAHTHGLDGHSDADVLIHAIMDALLGAAALGDIGKHFPNTDPQYRGISSVRLLEHVGGLLASRGYALVNVDATLILEAPKILPHVPRMQENIGNALGVDPGRISIKATTGEAMGFVGRGEGAAAHAVAALVQLP